MAKKDTRKLNIVVAVRDQTRKGLAKVKTGIKRVAVVVKKAGKQIAVALTKAFKVGLAAATVQVAFFVREIKRQFDEIDRLAKTAMRFGVAIENIRALELAAKLAGLSLSEMTTILRDTARRVQEASEGTGEAVGALEKLQKQGLPSARALAAMPVERQFDLIMKALEGIENQNERVAIAYDVMGRSGTQALTMVGKSIHSAKLETELLGTIITDDLARNVQQANDEVVRMKGAFSGLAQFVAADLAPVVTRIAKFIKQQLIDIRLGIKAIPITLEMEMLKMQQAFQKAGDAIKRTELGKLLLGGPKAGGIGRVGEGVTVTDPLQARIDALQKQLDDMASLPPALDKFKPPDVPGGGAARRVSPPSITQGRLLTGAAQSGPERLAAIAKEADERRQREARMADKQRNDMIDLLRAAVRNENASLGGLLQ